MKAIFLVDKPKGLSSFDVIRYLRKKLGIKKMGHSGTLDPLASGLLIIGVGKGTKKLQKLIGLPKVYEAEILLGKRTTTGDLEGKVIEEKETRKIQTKKIRMVLQSMIGKIKLVVPIYSAIKQKGEPLYKKARRGEKVDPPIKEMEIRWIKLKKIDQNIIILKLKVHSGAYIRSIAEEIGRRLGSPATIKNLRRLKIGRFSVKKAMKLD